MIHDNQGDEHPSASRSGGFDGASPVRSLGRLVGALRDRLRPTEYVHWDDAPDVPESPYRARVAEAGERARNDVEVGEPEVVRGEVTTIYEVRCPCGRRWFNLRLESVQVCPRCGSAVLLEQPGTSES